MGHANKRSPVAQYVKMETTLYPTVVFGTSRCNDSGDSAKIKHILCRIPATEEIPTPFKFVEMTDMGRQGKLLNNFLISYTEGKSAPFVFISGSYVGGRVELDRMNQDGSLKRAVDRMIQLLSDV